MKTLTSRISISRVPEAEFRAAKTVDEKLALYKAMLLGKRVPCSCRQPRCCGYEWRDLVILGKDFGCA
jgi:hypothetical protein